MKHKGVVRHYALLEADERFRLALRASARDDHEEVERLVRSCPTKDYRMSDPEFADRASGARFLAVLVVGEIRPHIARAAMLRASAEATKQAMIGGVESALEALESAPSEEERAKIYEAIEASSLPEAFADLVARELAQGAAVWQAFDSVCREEMALEPMTVMAATFGREFLRLHAEELDQVATAVADEDARAAWRDLFARRWRSAI